MKIVQFRFPQVIGGILTALMIIGILLFAIGKVPGTARASQASTPSTNDPVILIHGISKTSSTNCSDYWDATKSYLQGIPGQSRIQWTGPIVKLGYYKKDTNCDDGQGHITNLLATPKTDWRIKCKGYDGTTDSVVGTNNESIRHLACELAWYIYDQYSKAGNNVQIVAHSMGGLIARYALYAVQNHLSPFPPTLYVHDAVDLDVPNGGGAFVGTGFILGCGKCLEGTQMNTTDGFMNELGSNAQNPQGSAGTTWTLLGTSAICITGIAVPPGSSLYMDSSHKILYYTPCYPHYKGSNSTSLDMMHDSSDNLDASVAFCDNCTKDAVSSFSSWSTSSIYPHSLHEVLYAIYTNLPRTTAIVTVPSTGGQDGCLANTLPANDDNSSSAVGLPFTANFFGVTYSSVFVNNNGYVTFDAPLSDYDPYPLTSTSHAIIAPFFADVDTRGAGSSQVTYGNGVYQGHNTFCVNWLNVGYYSMHTDKLNSFQLLLVDRSDRKAGDFDVIMNYSQLQWETGDASGGTLGLGGNSARVGYSNGITTSLELSGSGVNGAFLDTNPIGLIFGNQGDSQLGRYVYTVQNTGTSRHGVVSNVIPVHKPKLKR